MDIITILKNIPIFQGFDNNDLNEIIPLLEPATYPPDTLIIKEGTNGTSMYIIINGTVKVSKTDEKNEEIFLSYLYTGSYFGELSLFDNLPRSANVLTVEETVIFKLEKKNFDNLLAINNKISNLFYKNCLTETFSRFRNNITNFTFSQHVLKEKSSILNKINKDLSLAKEIQNYFINTEYIDHEQNFLKNIRHSYIYQPCIEIGGDFFNIIELKNNHIAIIIADIMGHGITAALATGVLKSAFSIAVNQIGLKPKKLMKFLNRHLLRVISQLYATCYYALIDTKNKNIKMTKAGHHHPLFWKKSINDFIAIDCVGTGLGLIHDAQFSEVEFKIKEGDKILFFTDGIIEQKNQKKIMYSKSRLKKIFKELILENEKNILNKIFLDLKEFSEDLPFEDDITLLLLEF